MQEETDIFGRSVVLGALRLFWIAVAGIMISVMSAVAGTNAVTVQTEATIRGGSSADADQDEAAAGYIHVKYHSDLSSSRKAYFQFDLSGIAVDINQAATFTIDFISANAQAVTLWALDQDYPGFLSTVTWNQAQANEDSNALLTSGSYSATAIETGVLIPATEPYSFTISNPGEYIINDRLTLVLTGVDNGSNDSGGLRVKRQDATLHVQVLPPQGARIWSGEDITNITASSAWASAAVDTNLTSTVLVWDTMDQGTSSTNAWPSANRLGLGSTNAGNVMAQISGLDPDTQYTWRFYGENAQTSGWSTAETFATAFTSDQNPLFTNAVTISGLSTELGWQDNASNETSYILQRSVNELSGYTTIATLGENVTTYTDSGLSPETTYYYQLSATNTENSSSTLLSACRTNLTTDTLPGGTLVSVDHITGQTEDGSPLGYSVDSGNTLVGTAGPGGSRYDRNPVLGYSLPTLPQYGAITGAVFEFEVTYARDSENRDPELDVYLLDTADPASTGTNFFYHGSDDTAMNVAYVGSTYVDVGTSTTTYDDDTYDLAISLSGASLVLLQSFYGGDHVPDQSEAFFRFNLDLFPSIASYTRYGIDIDSSETRLVLSYEITPPPRTVFRFQ